VDVTAEKARLRAMNQVTGLTGTGAIRGGEVDPVRALLAASPHAPYLARLQTLHEHVVARLRDGESPEAVFASALEAMKAAASIAGPFEEPMAAMRRAKEAGHLVAAAADLSGVWALDKVVESLSALADEAVRSALTLATRASWASGRFGEKEEREDLPGFFALAMGKMGAHELNYSSDIDLILLFDLDVVPVEAGKVKEGMTRMTRDIVRLLEERTEDGYVFRTDLRLRPDPASTAPAVSTQFATGYYESVGQNWERMAHIKARVCAGDEEVGRDYLGQLEPYVWRRHLDYWAIADIHSIKRQIHSHGGHAALDAVDFDVKLGRGGIREIEFFAQVQQLIMGGRFPALREPRTKAALSAMAAAEVVTPEVCASLHQAYDFLRGLEHRIQMVNDEQTHRLPDIADKRQQVAALAGFEEQAAFEGAVAAARTRVHHIYSDLFAQEERGSKETLSSQASMTTRERSRRWKKWGSASHRASLRHFRPGTGAACLRRGRREAVSCLRRWRHGCSPPFLNAERQMQLSSGSAISSAA
jgi:glutamate-ammonia-ligase adenylyltransferase